MGLDGDGARRLVRRSMYTHSASRVSPPKPPTTAATTAGEERSALEAVSKEGRLGGETGGVADALATIGVAVIATLTPPSASTLSSVLALARSAACAYDRAR